MRVKTPNTIDELGQQGYSILIVSLDKDETKTKELEKKGFEFFNDKSAVDDRNFFHPLSKKVITYPRYPGSDRQTLILKNKFYNDPYKTTTDNVFVKLAGYSARKSNNLFKTFRDEFQRLFEAGITNKFYGGKFTDFLKDDKVVIYDDKKEFVKLSVGILKAGFIIWSVTVFISILVFFGEILHFKYVQKGKIEHKKRIVKIKNKLRKKFMRKLIQRKCMKIMKKIKKMRLLRKR